MNPFQQLGFGLSRTLFLIGVLFLFSTCQETLNTSKQPSTEVHGLELPRKSLETLNFSLLGTTPNPTFFKKLTPDEYFEEPIHLEVDPFNPRQWWVVERTGKIFIFNPQSQTKSLLLNLQALVKNFYAPPNTASGLLGFAFDPRHPINFKFYVNLTTRDGSSVISHVLQFTRNQNTLQVDQSSQKEILSFAQPDTTAHKAGMIAFGPMDGALYISTGDGGIPLDPDQHAQTLGNLMGKILRIHIEDNGYSIPLDNPFSNGSLCGKFSTNLTPPCAEIWAYGLRHPWRFSIDPATNLLWIGDVGHHVREEINRTLAGSNITSTKGGKNFGWNVCEGSFSPIDQDQTFCTFAELPFLDYPHVSAEYLSGYSVTGGKVYHGENLPQFKGHYIFSDFISGQVWAVSNNQTLEKVTDLPAITAFATDENHELLALTLSGEIYRWTLNPNPQKGVPSLLSQTGIFKDLKTLLVHDGIYAYDVIQPLWSDGALKKRWLALPQLSQIKFSENEPWQFPLGSTLIKHFEIKTLKGLKRLETRVLVLSDQGWRGFSYRWHEDQTDASLLTKTEFESILTPLGPVTWHYPANDCHRCHSPASGTLLGITPKQLRKKILYPNDVEETPLSAWKHIGLFSNKDDVTPEGTAFVSLTQAQQDPTQREQAIRSYLHSQCAHCHQPHGGTPARIDLRFDTPLEKTHLLSKALGDNLGTSGHILVPGEIHDSILWKRLKEINATTMPPLGKSIPDEKALQMIQQWINEDF